MTLPCPFCNQEVATVIKGVPGMYVMCHACGAVGPYRSLATDATSAWEARPTEASLRARVSELEAKLKTEKKAPNEET